MVNGTKVHHFLQGIKSTELETAIKVVWVKPEKNGTDFDATVPYLGHMFMKKILNDIYPYCKKQESAVEA